MIGRLVNRILGRPEVAPLTKPPGTEVAALVNAATLPTEIKAALLNPETALRPETAPQAIDAAAQLMVLSAARFKGDRPKSINAAAGFILAKTPVEAARVKLIEDLVAEDEAVGNLDTAHPQSAGIGKASAEQIYRSRKK